MVEDSVLDMIRSNGEGVLQSDIWKNIGIDSRKCSRVLSNLEGRGLIVRRPETVNGTRTYRVSYVDEDSKYSWLMVDDKIAPCAGCSVECNPETCISIEVWINALTRSYSE